MNIKELLFSGRVSFFEYGERQADKARTADSFSRSANYMTALRAFRTAVGDIALRNINSATVETFQDYMSRRGISKNTASCYNRALRAIYNHAVSEGLVRDRDPFASAFTGRVKTRKRSVREDSIRRLKGLNLYFKPSLEAARDYFLFSFYTMGMPFVDLACLRRDQICGNSIFYNRHKTGAPVRIPLCDEAMAIVSKYSAVSQTPFVFPLITETDPRRAYRQYCTRLGNYNRLLKKLARLAGITDRLTSYTVRHSWASIAYRSDVPLSVISQALGHKSTDMTMTYIRELDVTKLREGNDKVLAAIKE